MIAELRGWLYKMISISKVVIGLLAVPCIDLSWAHAAQAQDQQEKHNIARGLFQKALTRSDSGDFASAADLLQQAVQLDDNYSRAHANLGWSLMKLGRKEQALTE